MTFVPVILFFLFQLREYCLRLRNMVASDATKGELSDAIDSMIEEVKSKLNIFLVCFFIYLLTEWVSTTKVFQDKPTLLRTAVCHFVNNRFHRWTRAAATKNISSRFKSKFFLQKFGKLFQISHFHVNWTLRKCETQ